MDKIYVDKPSIQFPPKVLPKIVVKRGKNKTEKT
jgi:hypothetical protein